MARSQRTLLALLLLLPAMAGLGCASHEAPATVAVQRDTSPTVAAGDEGTLVAGNSDFAFALYPGVATQAGGANLFYSPYSVSLALAMTYAGAAGSTATQVAEAMRFTLPPARLHPTFDALDLAIEATPKGATGADGQPFAINIADSLWPSQEIMPLTAPFTNTLGADYGAAPRPTDFSQQQAALSAINGWVSDHTDGKIKQLLSLQQINEGTRFVIVNAVYFNASWASSFDPTVTTAGAFTRADGSTVQAQMMSSLGAATGYAKGAGWQAIELPYSGGTTSMVIVLPDPGQFAATEKALSGSFFSHVTASLSGADINLTMPRFAIHGGTVSLVPALKALGMTDAFDPSAADFSAMTTEQALYLSDVVHQAFVDVDETGTEAAAATAVVGAGLAIGGGGGPMPVTVDRAFFFFVRDIATNTVLFVGREGDPTAL